MRLAIQLPSYLVVTVLLVVDVTSFSRALVRTILDARNSRKMSRCSHRCRRDKEGHCMAEAFSGLN
jgi:hypothetical protein